MAWLVITGAMRSTPTAAMEVLLKMTPLDLFIMAEARMALYWLQITKQLSASEAETGLLSIWKNVSDPILEMWADHIIPVFNHSRTFKVIIDQNYWRNVNPLVPEDTLVWFTDGPRMPSGTGSEFLALDQIGAWASLWVNSQQSLRLKYMPYYNAHMKI
jgi:hypothetical protein